MRDTTPAALIRPLIPALRRFALSLERERDAADDLVQDTLERAVAHWHDRHSDGDLRAWMFAILHNRFVSRLRERRRDRLSGRLDELDHEPSVAAVGDDRLAVRDVLTGLAALPTDQKAVLSLVAVEGLTYEEAARVLDIPVGTVMSRLSRAREGLRRLLDGDGGRPFTLRRVK